MVVNQAIIIGKGKSKSVYLALDWLRKEKFAFSVAEAGSVVEVTYHNYLSEPTAGIDFALQQV